MSAQHAFELAIERAAHIPDPANNPAADPGQVGNDFCSMDGADKLRVRIEEYWRDRGYEVETKRHFAGFVQTMRSARYDVRSDMLNGLPTRRAP